MFDTEKLIIEVEQRPCLWNLSEKSDRYTRQMAWHEVGENCFEEWNFLTNEDKEDKLNFLKKKWKVVRDYYIREKRYDNDVRSGSAAKRRKKLCPYFDLLQFLKDYTQPKNSCPNNVTCPGNTDNDDSNTMINSNSDDDDPNERFESTSLKSEPPTSQPPSITDYLEASMETPNNQPPISNNQAPIINHQASTTNNQARQEYAPVPTSAYQNLPSTSNPNESSQNQSHLRTLEQHVLRTESPSLPRTKIKKPSLTPFEETLLKRLENKPNTNDENPNRYFLLSLLPEMSNMTERQNFEFRMEIMKALNKVKYQIPE